MNVEGPYYRYDVNGECVETIHYDENGMKIPPVHPVDEMRMKMIDGLSERERHSFALGLGFHGAYFTVQELKLGGSPSPSDLDLLEKIIKSLEILEFNELAKDFKSCLKI